MSEQNHTPEPFGYFKPEPFGWTDCAETDDGAIPLFDKVAIRSIQKQRDELLAALREISDDYADRFDLSSPSTNPGIKYVIENARAAIANAKHNGQHEKQPENESAAPAIVFYPAGSLGEEVNS